MIVIDENVRQMLESSILQNSNNKDSRTFIESAQSVLNKEGYQKGIVKFVNEMNRLFLEKFGEKSLANGRLVFEENENLYVLSVKEEHLLFSPTNLSVKDKAALFVLSKSEMVEKAIALVEKEYSELQKIHLYLKEKVDKIINTHFLEEVNPKDISDDFPLLTTTGTPVAEVILKPNDLYSVKVSLDDVFFIARDEMGIVSRLPKTFFAPVYSQEIEEMLFQSLKLVYEHMEKKRVEIARNILVSLLPKELHNYFGVTYSSQGYVSLIKGKVYVPTNVTKEELELLIRAMSIVRTLKLVDENNYKALFHFLMVRDKMENGYSLKQRTISMYITNDQLCDFIQIIGKNIASVTMFEFIDTLPRNVEDIAVTPRVYFKSIEKFTHNGSEFVAYEYRTIKSTKTKTKMFENNCVISANRYYRIRRKRNKQAITI